MSGERPVGKVLWLWESASTRAPVAPALLAALVFMTCVHVWGDASRAHSEPALLTLFGSVGISMLLAAVLWVRLHKFSEQSLRDSEAKFRSLFDLAAVGVAQVDSSSGNFLETNQKFADITGYSREELLQLNYQVMVYPDGQQAAMERVKALREGTIPRYTRQKRCQRKDGSEVWVNLRVSPMWQPGEQPTSFIAVITDITDRLRADEELRDSHERLRKLSGHLESVREEERLRISREVHDGLGQALTALKFDLASLRKNELFPAELSDQLTGMSEAVVSTIHSVQRISSELRPRLLDDLGLEAALEWQAGVFEKRTGISCCLELCAVPPPLTQERSTAIFRIFQEALTNILRHAGATKIAIGLAVNGGVLSFSVADNGRGITPEELCRRDSYGIMGMRERAVACGGEISLQGTPGLGSLVRVQMPIAEREVLAC